MPSVDSLKTKSSALSRRDKSAIEPGVRNRYASVIRMLPVFVAALAAFVEVTTMGGFYFSDATQFLRQTFYSHRVTKPWDNFIPPSYPLFLDAVCLIVPHAARMYAVVLIQQAGVVAVVWMLLRIGELLDRRWAGYAASWMAALYLPLGLFAQTLQTESLYILFVVACMYCIARSWASGHGGWMLCAGGLAGLAMAQRAVGIVIPAVFLLASWIGTDKLRLRNSVLFLMAFGCVTALFVVKNGFQYGRFNLVMGTGIHLFQRIAVVDQWTPDTEESRLLRKIAAATGYDTIFFMNAGWHFSVELVQKMRLTSTEANALLRTVALQTFAADPLRAMGKTVWAMCRIMNPVNPIQGHLGGGLRPEGFQAFTEYEAETWKRWPEPHRAMQALISPYPPPATLGEWPFALIENWAKAVLIWRGSGWLVVMALTFGAGVLWRNREILFFSGLALAQLAAAAIGDQPLTRYVEPSMPPWFLALAITAALGFSGLSRQSGREPKPSRGDS